MKYKETRSYSYTYGVGKDEGKDGENEGQLIDMSMSKFPGMDNYGGRKLIRGKISVRTIDCTPWNEIIPPSCSAPKKLVLKCYMYLFWILPGFRGF